MILPGHLAGGYITTKAVLSFLQPSLTSTQINSILIIGTLAGELPDIDIAILFFEEKVLKKIRHEHHREYITHTPLFWSAISLLIFIVGFLWQSFFVELLSLVILIGSWSHLLLDSIDYGIKWFWPFSKRRYALKYPKEGRIDKKPRSIPYYVEFIRKYYICSVSFYIEILLTLAAIILLFK